MLWKYYNPFDILVHYSEWKFKDMNINVIYTLFTRDAVYNLYCVHILENVVMLYIFIIIWVVEQYG